MHEYFTGLASTYSAHRPTYPADAIGAHQNYDLFPTVSAIIVQVGYTFDLFE